MNACSKFTFDVLETSWTFWDFPISFLLVFHVLLVVNRDSLIVYKASIKKKCFEIFFLKETRLDVLLCLNFELLGWQNLRLKCIFLRGKHSEGQRCVWISQFEFISQVFFVIKLEKTFMKYRYTFLRFYYILIYMIFWPFFVQFGYIFMILFSKLCDCTLDEFTMQY